MEPEKNSKEITHGLYSPSQGCEISDNKQATSPTGDLIILITHKITFVCFVWSNSLKASLCILKRIPLVTS